MTLRAEWRRDNFQASEPETVSSPAFLTQSAATVSSEGDRLYVVDRQRRLIGIVDPGTFGDSKPMVPQEWLSFEDIDPLLEGRPPESPPSLFGATEGIATDEKGRLYLLADNNESSHSRLVVLFPRN
jgi:hypothetical protein